MKFFLFSLLYGLAFAFGCLLYNPFVRNQPKSYGEKSAERLIVLQQALLKYRENCGEFPLSLASLQTQGLIDAEYMTDLHGKEWVYHVTNEGVAIVASITKTFVGKKDADSETLSTSYEVSLEVKGDGRL